MTLSEDLRSIFGKMGYPTIEKELETPEKENIGDFFPNELKNLYLKYGRFVWRNGLMQLCHPDDLSGILAMIFNADQDFHHRQCYAYAYSSFGKIFFWHNEYGAASVDLISGEVICRILTKKIAKNTHFTRTFVSAFSTLNDAYDFYDINDKPLFSRAQKKLGEVGIGECYGFVPALGLGGVPELETLKKLRAPEHFAILAQLIDFQLIDIQGYGKSVVVRKIG